MPPGPLNQMGQQLSFVQLAERSGRLRLRPEEGQQLLHHGDRGLLVGRHGAEADTRPPVEGFLSEIGQRKATHREKPKQGSTSVGRAGSTGGRGADRPRVGVHPLLDRSFGSDRVLPEVEALGPPGEEDPQRNATPSMRQGHEILVRQPFRPLRLPRRQENGAVMPRGRFARSGVVEKQEGVGRPAARADPQPQRTSVELMQFGTVDHSTGRYVPRRGRVARRRALVHQPDHALPLRTGQIELDQASTPCGSPGLLCHVGQTGSTETPSRDRRGERQPGEAGRHPYVRRVLLSSALRLPPTGQPSEDVGLARGGRPDHLAQGHAPAASSPAPEQDWITGPDIEVGDHRRRRMPALVRPLALAGQLVRRALVVGHQQPARHAVLLSSTHANVQPPTAKGALSRFGCRATTMGVFGSRRVEGGMTPRARYLGTLQPGVVRPNSARDPLCSRRA